MARMGSREHVLLAQKTRLRIELIVKGHLRVGTLWSLLWADRGAICSRQTPCIDSKRRSSTVLILVRFQVNTLEELTQLHWKRCFAKNINKLPMVYWSSTAFALLVIVTHTHCVQPINTAVLTTQKWPLPAWTGWQMQAVCFILYRTSQKRRPARSLCGPSLHRGLTRPTKS